MASDHDYRRKALQILMDEIETMFPPKDFHGKLTREHVFRAAESVIVKLLAEKEREHG